MLSKQIIFFYIFSCKISKFKKFLHEFKFLNKKKNEKKEKIILIKIKKKTKK